MRRRWPLLAGAAVAFLLVPGCGETRKSAPAQPNVLLITLDTTRADAVGPGRHTPVLEAFRQEATCFPGACTPVPLTLPAHVTLLSGLEPRHHGVHENLVPPLPRERGFSLLAEEFREAGYATAAFVSSPVVGRATGIDAGFATFDSPSFPGDSWSGEQGDLLAPERVAGPLRWLGARDRKVPYFLWVHFFDPHVPYLPFTGDATHPGTRPTDPVAALYAGEVRRIDAVLAPLLEAAGRDALVVIASDHGEGLGEHGEDTHGVLCYGATLDVTLAVRGPGFPAGAERGGVRSLTDVAPTLRRACGLPPRPQDGLALQEDARDRVLVSESLWSYRTYGWAQAYRACDGRFSLVETGPRLMLFDLAQDPDEKAPLEPEGHPAYERLDRALLAYRATTPANTEPAGPYMAAGSPYGTAVRPLAAYLPRAENARLRDPSDGFAFRDSMERAKLLIHRGQVERSAAVLEEALSLLERLSAEDPGNPAPWLYLAHAQGRLGTVLGRTDPHRAAVRAAHAAIEKGYRVAPLLYDLLHESLEGGASEDLRGALDVAWGGGIIPDLHCAELVAQAGRTLAARGDAEGAALADRFLERMERAAGDASEKEQLAAWRSVLAEARDQR